MDVSEHVLLAGRAVLDMMEREWQPRSAGELERRLDQAVEEILEADLVAKPETPQTVNVQFLQSKSTAGPQILPAATNPPEARGRSSSGRGAAGDRRGGPCSSPGELIYVQ